MANIPGVTGVYSSVMKNDKVDIADFIARPGSIVVDTSTYDVFVCDSNQELQMLRGGIQKFYLSATQTTGQQTKINFDTQEFLNGSALVTNSGGNFVFQKNGYYRVTINYNVTITGGTYDAWAVLGGDADRYCQLAGSQAKGSITETFRASQNQTFLFKDNNNNTWNGGNITGSYITFEQVG